MSEGMNDQEACPGVLSGMHRGGGSHTGGQRLEKGMISRREELLGEGGGKGPPAQLRSLGLYPLARRRVWAPEQKSMGKMRLVASGRMSRLKGQRGQSSWGEARGWREQDL